jgi:hypothetical protein
MIATFRTPHRKAIAGTELPEKVPCRAQNGPDEIAEPFPGKRSSLPRGAPNN